MRISTVRADSAGSLTVHEVVVQVALTVLSTLDPDLIWALSAPAIGRNPVPATLTVTAFPAGPDFGDTPVTLTARNFVAAWWQSTCVSPATKTTQLFACSPLTMGTPRPLAMSKPLPDLYRPPL